jgi:AcrR family transcriptional regulator
MQDRKRELIDAIIAYLLKHGLADVSLRPLAAKSGTSSRLLIYHFESKEGLLTEVLLAMQGRVRRSCEELLAEVARNRKGLVPLRLFWGWATNAENFPYLKLLYELQILAIQNPSAYAKYLADNSVNWLDFAMAAMSAEHRTPEFATLCGAVFDGLFLELMSTGDRKRTGQALEAFIRLAGGARDSSRRKNEV